MSRDTGEAGMRFEVKMEGPDYPAHLRDTPNPPAALRGYGRPDALVRGVGVIGARKATPYGLHAARLFAGWAAGAGYTVVSGAALGCDTAAHRAALDSGGTTVAVLGCGADVAYPRGSEPLLREIARSGAVVSELDWGHPPAKWTFRARNRIIAGLSGVLLVVEAGLGSGTFVTADYALDAGRTVAVVPGSIFSPECRGSNRLLAQGAVPVSDVSELRAVLEAEIGEAGGSVATPFGPERTTDRVLAALLSDPMRPDDLARELALDIVTVARRIGRLESSGLISRYRDGRYGP